MAEILIVDDERAVREGLKADLLGEGYEVRTARDGDDALAKISERRPDLVLLDVMMPKMNGFRCCEEIRKTDMLLPVIFLTAKDAEGDQIRAMGLGADDFVSKSASDALLLACIRRALVRSQEVDEKVKDGSNRYVRLGRVVVDISTLGVVEDGREIARLTKTEADILRCLYVWRGEVVSFDDLITDLRGNGYVCEDTMLYAHVSRLRGKLGKAGDLIATTRGVGYCLLR